MFAVAAATVLHMLARGTTVGRLFMSVTPWWPWVAGLKLFLAVKAWARHSKVHGAVCTVSMLVMSGTAELSGGRKFSASVCCGLSACV